MDAWFDVLRNRNLVGNGNFWTVEKIVKRNVQLVINVWILQNEIRIPEWAIKCTSWEWESYTNVVFQTLKVDSLADCEKVGDNKCAYYCESDDCVADDLGLYVPEGYHLLAKTGTAETGSGDFLYITGCVKNNNDNGQNGATASNYSDYRANGGSYVIVMQIQNPKDHNFSFASESAQLYKGIIDIVFSNW